MEKTITHNQQDNKRLLSKQKVEARVQTKLKQEFKQKVEAIMEDPATYEYLPHPLPSETYNERMNKYCEMFRKQDLISLATGMGDVEFFRWIVKNHKEYSQKIIPKHFVVLLESRIRGIITLDKFKMFWYKLYKHEGPSENSNYITKKMAKNNLCDEYKFAVRNGLTLHINTLLEYSPENTDIKRYGEFILEEIQDPFLSKHK